MLSPAGVRYLFLAFAGLQVTDGNNEVTTFEYDGRNRLITPTYTNDPVGLTQVLVANNGRTQVYNLFGLDLISQDDGTGMRTLLADGLGSVRQETAVGAVETTTSYGPYGALLARTGASGTVYGYTGEQEDSAAGLVYLRARYYNPYLNQFMSRDPWNGNMQQPQTLNGYSYVLNNSVNFTDPSGLICIFGFGNCDEDPDYGTLPWRLMPDDICLPGNLGCLGGSGYADWLENFAYPNQPLQYTFNNVILDPPDFRVTETSPFCNDSWLEHYDLTSWLVNQMNANATGNNSQTIQNLKQSGPDGWLSANVMWAMMVKGSAPWDFKPDISDAIDTEIMLAGTWYRHDIVANIHYGYVSRAIGFNREWMHFGAGMAQIENRTSNRSWGTWYFDDPRDYTAVKVGMDLYDRYGRYGNITEEELAIVLEENKALLPLAEAKIPPGVTP